MSKRVTLPNGKSIALLCVESPTDCAFCGAHTETRGYGPGGNRICHPCAKSTPEMWRIVEHNAGILLFGEKGELL